MQPAGGRATERVGAKRSTNNSRRFMDADVLSELWRNEQCSHKYAVLSVNGLRAASVCRDCGHTIEFVLRFGRPRKMDVYDKYGRAVGSVRVRDAADFLLHNTHEFVESATGHTRRDEYETNITLSMLYYRPDAPPPSAPAADFAAVWNGMDCKHKNTECVAYASVLRLQCGDCGATVRFMHVGDGGFDVSLAARAPAQPTECGRHGADAVINMVRSSTSLLLLPDKLADRMSESPDRDARALGKLVLLLERHGLLRRFDIDAPKLDVELSMSMSAVLHTRRAFAATVRAMAPDLRSMGGTFTEDGKVVGMRRMLEVVWLSWPFLFNGVGIDVMLYPPDGRTEYCVRCGFSTLDDEGAGPDRWQEGCPECGYDGYLLGLASLRRS